MLRTWLICPGALIANIIRVNYIVGMRIGNLNLESNLILAPLAGISKRPFRILARRYGAALCYTEMISADALARNHKKTLRMLDHAPDEHPIGVQLFGSQPEFIALATRKLMEYGLDIIDINLGCPVPKVIKRNGGAALLKDPALAEKIMAAAVENSKIPVTIKTRAGWSADSQNYLEIGRRAQKVGIAAMTLHPRCRTEGFAGKSDWSLIKRLKQEISIPVIGNGDVKTPEDAKRMLDETGCDAVMIGRAAMTNPYIFKIIGEYLNHGRIISDMTPAEKVDMALEHARLMGLQYPDPVASRMMRKHLAWYTRGFPEGHQLRRDIMKQESYVEMEKCLNNYLVYAANLNGQRES